jgi:hypothetical protein
MYVVEIVVRLIVSVESTVVVAAAVSIKVVENKLTLVNVTAASVSVAEAVTVLVLQWGQSDSLMFAKRQDYTVAGVIVLKKKEEQSAAAEDGEGKAALAMTARRQLLREQVGLMVCEKTGGRANPKALPQRAAKTTWVRMMQVLKDKIRIDQSEDTKPKQRSWKGTKLSLLP